MGRATHTYTVLEVSQAVYDEIREKLMLAGRFTQTIKTQTSFRKGLEGGLIVEEVEVIDMHGIALSTSVSL